MGSFSDYLELEILDHVFGAQAYTAPTGTHVALSTTTPVDAGTNFTEPAAGSGYARVTENNNKTTWSTAAAGALENDIAITFPQATGGGWGTITHFGIYDAAAAGNLLGWGALTSSRLISDGDTPQFASGDLDITLD